MKKQVPQNKKEKQGKKDWIDTNPIKEEYLRWLFVIISTIACFSIIGWVITKIYNPDIAAIIAATEKVALGVGGIHPEPHESLLYKIGLLFIPFMLLGFYWLSKKDFLAKYFKQPKSVNVLTIVISVALLLGIYLMFSAANPNYVGANAVGANEHDSIAKTNFEFYFLNLFIDSQFYVYLFIFFPLILTAFFLIFRQQNFDKQKLIHKIFSISTWIIFGLLMLIIISISCFEFPYTWQNKLDFDAIYYSVTQVYAGNGMLIDGLTNTYGLYPSLLNPIFKVIGLSIYKFTLVMTICIVLSYFFQAFFINKYLKNKFLFLLGVLLMLFMSYFDNKLHAAFDPFFSVAAIRSLTFSALLFGSVFYIKRKSNALFYTISIIQAVLTLWNPEIGLVSFVAWIALLIYVHFYTEAGKINYKGILKRVAISIVLLILTYIAYIFIIKIIYGQYPDILGLFNVAYAFASLSVYLIPMTLIHPWLLFVLINIIGLLYSIVQLYNKNITSKSSAIFLLSILAAGLFSYYSGRSHNWTLLSFSAITIMLLTLLVDELWIQVQQSKLLAFKIIFSISIFILAIGLVETVGDNTKLTQLVKNTKKDKSIQLEEELRIKENQKFIVNNTRKGETIFLLTSIKYQVLLLDANKNRSGAHPGFFEMTLKSQVAEYAKTIRDSSFKMFIEPGYFYYPQYAPLCASMASSYQFASTSNTICLLKKRPLKPAYKSIILETNSSDSKVAHEVFQDNKEGLAKRADWALGKNPVKLGKVFTAEVVFEPATQIYNYPAIMGNQKDSAGFGIIYSNQPNLYYFSIAGQNVPITVAPAKMYYIAAVVNEKNLKIFVNGNQVAFYTMPKDYIESGMPLYIGNLENLRYYLGYIGEASITKQEVSAEEISKRWMSLQSFN